MNEIHNHMDISMKYGFLTLGRYIHEFFDLPGNYEYDTVTEVITQSKRNLRMDVAYYSKTNLINNIENQGSIVDYEKLESIAEYTKFLLIHNNALVNSIVISRVDPKYCQKEIYLTKSLILRPYYIYMSPDEILELLNTIRYKVNNKKKLTNHEKIALAILPTIAQDEIACKVTVESCHLVEKYPFEDKMFRYHICFILDIMIDRNIKNKKLRKKLRKGLKMNETKSVIRKLVEQENKELIQEIKKENEEMQKEIEEMQKQMEVEKEQIKNRYKNELEMKNREIEYKDKINRDYANILKMIL